ncbi:hypothetical protein F4803DRAFT_544782 [Xylaria telfairii]|nr:hypothetical protein F4803DRAFT_544782 [Xylaria telfairii]
MNYKAARDLIQKIWQENTLNGTIGNKECAVGKILEKALAILSQELCDKETHFLLELIQNADDNTYSCENPEVNFTYRKGSLRVDCNEVGFTESDIRAICQIGQSTKAGLGRSKRYIGEKGIGFKSVFKVAHTVYISSRTFSFKFDQSQPTGIIAPIWAEFPEPALPGYTSFLLQLSPSCDEEQLAREIQDLDPNLLIFTRTLRQINLTIMRDGHRMWTRKLWRQVLLHDVLPVTVLHSGNSHQRHVVIRHCVSQLPFEEKRLNCSESELLIAFPLSDNNIPPPRHTTYPVYAFLPVQDYGFKFLLQADFLLTANREGILDIPWNRALRDAAADGFVSAIQQLNLGALRYMWPFYLPTNEIYGFFEPLKEMIYQGLSECHVLESFSGTMEIPSMLTYVPKGDFLDTNGIPFTLSSKTRSTYLSSHYSPLVLKSLSSLATTFLYPKDFLNDLNWMVSEESAVFRQKAATWHSQLARVLIILATNEDNKAQLQEMELIPLQGGRWVSVKQGPVYFHTRGTRNLVIPDALLLKTVDPAVTSDSYRRNLFAQIGVQPLPDTTDICRMIIEIHNTKTFDPQSFTCSQLVSHAWFLFRASFRPQRGDDLWFATSQGQRVKGSRVYMRVRLDTEYVPAKIMKQLQEAFPFIHEDYINASPFNDFWVTWLKESLRIAVLPRICTAEPDAIGTYDLSDEFKYLFQNCDSADVLQILVDNWNAYSRRRAIIDLTAPMTIRTSSQITDKIGDKIASTLVTCGTSKTDVTFKMPLRDTFLPIDGIVDTWSKVPRPVIRDPSHPRWHILSKFGVSVTRSVHYYLCSLQSMQDLSPPKKVVDHIYHVLHSQYNEDLDIIRKAFSEHDIIYTASGSSNISPQMRWVSLVECVERDLDIASEYCDSAPLFRCLIKGKTPGIGLLIEAASNHSETAKLGTRLEFLVKINRALQSRRVEDAIEAIKPIRQSTPIFPIIRGWNNTEYDDILPLHPCSPPWFIADRHHLRDSFRGVVDLLAFTPEDLDSIKTLLDLLDLQPRRLSKIVSCEEAPIGKPKRNKKYTSLLRKKAQFITALIPKSRPTRDSDIRQFNRAEVKIVPRVAQKYKFTYDTTVFIGHEGEGQVCFAVEDGRLQVFMTRDSIGPSIFPPGLINGIVNRYGIVEPSHHSLLLYTVYEDDFDRLVSAFRREGIHVTGDGPGESTDKYSALWRDEFIDTFSEAEEDDDDFEDGILSNFKHIPTNFGDTDEELSDRRLPLQIFKWSERFLYRNITSDPCADYRAVLKQEPAHSQYLGELMTSQVLQHYLGTYYNPEQHWTSPLRVKSGYSMFEFTLSTCASFTIADHEVSWKVTDFLVQQGCSEVGSWAYGANLLTYYFDVAVSIGDSKSPFPWTSQQFERMRRFRVDKKSGPTNPRKVENIHVLVRISNVFANPCIDLFVDPWRLLISDRFVLPSDWTLTAAIASEAPDDDDKETLSQQTAKMSIFQPPPPKSMPVYGTTSWHGPVILPPVIVYGSTGMVSRPRRNTQITTIQQPPKPLNVRFPPAEDAISPYPYKSLGKGDIRLLLLHPGDNHDDLRGVIFQTPLLRSSSFQAISYSWNGTELSHSLWTPEGGVNITASLSTALRGVRHRNDAVVLWADAICINQGDLTEKKEQIPLLPQVFQRATCVLVFLGGDSDGEAAIEALMQIRVNEALKSVGEEWPKDLPSIPRHWDKKAIPPVDDTIWSEIDGFFGRAWFQRAWIIQEVVAAMSVRVVCGKWMVDWNDLLTAVEIIMRETQVSRQEEWTHSPPKWNRFLTLARQREQEARHLRRPLLELLETVRYAESSEDHDRFFCLLGLAIDGNNSDFVLDYNMDFDVVVRKYAGAFVAQGKALELLYRAGLSPRPTKLFPSWIPDWTMGRQPSLRTLASRGMPCAASWRAKPRFEYDPTNEFQLGAHGIQADKIKIVSKASNVPEELSAYFKEIDSMLVSLS